MCLVIDRINYGEKPRLSRIEIEPIENGCSRALNFYFYSNEDRDPDAYLKREQEEFFNRECKINSLTIKELLVTSTKVFSQIFVTWDKDSPEFAYYRVSGLGSKIRDLSPLKELVLPYLHLINDNQVSLAQQYKDMRMAAFKKSVKQATTEQIKKATEIKQRIAALKRLEVQLGKKKAKS